MDGRRIEERLAASCSVVTRVAACRKMVACWSKASHAMGRYVEAVSVLKESVNGGVALIGDALMQR